MKIMFYIHTKSPLSYTWHPSKNQEQVLLKRFCLSWRPRQLTKCPSVLCNQWWVLLLLQKELEVVVEKKEFYRAVPSQVAPSIGDQRDFWVFFTPAFWRLQGELVHNLQSLFCSEMFLYAQDVGSLRHVYLNSRLLVFPECSSVLVWDLLCNLIIKIWFLRQTNFGCIFKIVLFSHRHILSKAWENQNKIYFWEENKHRINKQAFLIRICPMLTFTTCWLDTMDRFMEI